MGFFYKNVSAVKNAVKSASCSFLVHLYMLIRVSSLVHKKKFSSNLAHTSKAIQAN